MKRLIRLVVVAAVAMGWQVAAPAATLAHEDQSNKSAESSCDLGNGVKHVVNVVFDNTHFTRDNPNVPSDLQQMPALLNFLQGQGTLLTNEHTPLIAHTATDILTALTGTYGDNMGVPISNSYRYYLPSGSTSTGVSFAYWTAPIFDPTGAAGTDLTTNMLTAQGKNAPAPWVPFTRAGCDVGAFSTANIEFENVSSDINNVFGSTSWEAQEAASNFDKAVADFEGISIHCTPHSRICGRAGQPDKLPDEPGGYDGFGC